MVDPIRMTWPEYRRSECLYYGRRVLLCPSLAELLAILLLNRGRAVQSSDLIEALWPNPDLSPDWGQCSVRLRVKRLRARLPGLVQTIGHAKGCEGWMIPLPGHDVLNAAA